MFEVRSSVVRDVIEKCKFESDALLIACKHVLENEASASVYAMDETPPALLWQIDAAWPTGRDIPPGNILSVKAPKVV